MGKIKILLSDPQVLFREGIHFTLSGEDEFEVTGETTNNQEALICIDANTPHIAVLSVKDDKIDGLNAARRIKRNFPSTNVILIIDKDQPDILFAAIKSGASACIDKDIDPEYLLNLIRVVAQGSFPMMETLLLPEIAIKVLEDFDALSNLSEQYSEIFTHLSEKERKVLRTIATGKEMEDITTALETNEESIRRYLRLIMNKLMNNEQSRVLLEKARQTGPALLPGSVLEANLASQFVPRKEFDEFKKSLNQRFQSFVGDISQPF